jgi:very-short-patch-repair endonuclease
MTDAERLIWQHLRQRQLSGARFRRQFPIDLYIVDFICLEQRLIVEVDGGQHQDSAHDKRRDDWLRSQGFVVMRFWNNEVLQNTDGVLEEILKHVNAGHPHPRSAPSAASDGALVGSPHAARIPPSPPVKGGRSIPDYDAPSFYGY